jgi:hypothetical protein
MKFAAFISASAALLLFSILHFKNVFGGINLILSMIVIRLKHGRVVIKPHGDV